MKTIIKITIGMRIGKLIVMKIAFKRNAFTYYRLQCDCGNIIINNVYELMRRKQKSCGCKDYIYLLDMQLNDSIRTYTANATTRNLRWNLSIADAKYLMQQPCFYCKKLSMNKCGFKYNGIDRLDSTIGYETLNCVPACKNCNLGKQGQNLSEYLNHIKTTYENLQLQNL